MKDKKVGEQRMVLSTKGGEHKPGKRSVRVFGKALVSQESAEKYMR